MSFVEGEKILADAKKKESIEDYQGAVTIILTASIVHQTKYRRRALKLLCRNYNRLSNFKSALEYATRLMDYVKKVQPDTPKSKREYAKTQCEMMIAYTGLERYAESRKICGKAVDYLYANGFDNGVLHVRFSVACCKVALLYKNYQAALDTFVDAKTMINQERTRTEKNSMRWFLDILSGIAECHRQLKQYKESVRVYIEVLSYLVSKTDWVYADILRRLATSYVGIYQYELSYQCLKEAHSILCHVVGKDDQRSKNTVLQMRILKRTLDDQRLCSICNVSKVNNPHGGSVCGKQSCMERAWIIRGGVDSLVCSGCGGNFAMLSPGGKKCGECSKKL